MKLTEEVLQKARDNMKNMLIVNYRDGDRYAKGFNAAILGCLTFFDEAVHLAKPLAESAVAPGECGSVPFTSHELDLLRQWFNGVTAWNRAYLTPDDQALMLKIALLQSGMQLPDNQPNSDHVAVISAKPDSDHLDKPVETATNPRLTADHIIATALSYGHPVEELFVGFFKRELVTFVRRLEKDSAFAPPMLSDLQEREAVERSFNASKYMQVVYSPNSRQPYIDGWNAALLALQSGISSPTYRPNEQAFDLAWSQADESKQIDQKGIARYWFECGAGSQEGKQ